MVVCRFSQSLTLYAVEMTDSGNSDLPFMRFTRRSQPSNLPEEWTDKSARLTSRSIERPTV